MNPREEVTQAILESLEEGTVPWEQPWDSVNLHPHNPISGTDYKGINKILLWKASVEQGFSDPRWMTFKQALYKEDRYSGDDEDPFADWEDETHVMKGESSPASVFYWFRNNPYEDEQNELEDILDDDSVSFPVTQYNHSERQEVTYTSPRDIQERIEWIKTHPDEVEESTYYKPTSWSVFNADQITGVPEFDPGDIGGHEWDPIDRAEQIIRASGAEIHHTDPSMKDGGLSAKYIPSRDCIEVPRKEYFETPYKYYSTTLHELAHWTGPRLERDASGPKGSDSYAREELRAEIGSAMMFAELGLNPSGYLENHASYVDSWVDQLKNDENEIIRASRDAEDIVDFLVHEPDMEETTGPGTTVTPEL